MASHDAPTTVSSRVPFKWEEAPGKPIGAALTSSCSPEMMPFNPTPLQLPPKLQFPLHQAPLSLQHSPCDQPSWLHQSIPLTLQSQHSHSPSPNHHKLKRLYAYMLKTASWSQPLHSLSPSWSSSACAITDAQHNDLTINERFFFDKALSKQFKYSLSMPDSWKAQLPIHEEYKRPDVLVNSQALSLLAMEEREAKSNASSPLHPIVFHERHGSACPCQPIPIKASKELGGDGDDDDDEGFHDFFSTASSSLEKPSQRTYDSMESSCPSPSPWFLDFGPEEHEVHEEKERSKLVVRLVAIVNLKKMISSKVWKLRKRREGANQQANHTSMWSPTLATYLFNEQKEEKESSSASLTDHVASEEEEVDDDDNDDNDDNDDSNDDDDNDDDFESHSISSAASSDGFRINPHYHPPSSILRGYLQPDNCFLESEGSSSFRLQFSQELYNDEEEGEQQEELQTLRHRLSLREQLAEFDDEYPLQHVPNDQSLAPQVLDSQRRELTPCKGMCKVRKTVKVLVATIKLILVQTEGGKRKGQRPSLKHGGCFKPTISTLSAFLSTHD